MSLDDLASHAADSLHWREALLSILVGYLLSQAIAAVYAWTYRGLSYSRSLVQALAAGGIVASMLMLAIGNSLARGIAIVGTLALIRFRTNLRDPLDMIFVFASFGAGIAAGTGSFATGIIGTAVFLVVITVLRLTSFGAFRDFEGVLHLRLPSSPEAEAALKEILSRECARFSLITLREVAQGREVEHAYQVTLLRAGTETALLQALSSLPGAEKVSLSMQEPTLDL